jgi:hypothetical protein
MAITQPLWSALVSPVMPNEPDYALPLMHLPGFNSAIPIQI